jgi:hypothetical protein
VRTLSVRSPVALATAISQSGRIYLPSRVPLLDSKKLLATGGISERSIDVLVYLAIPLSETAHVIGPIRVGLRSRSVPASNARDYRDKP